MVWKPVDIIQTSACVWKFFPFFNSQSKCWHTHEGVSIWCIDRDSPPFFLSPITELSTFYYGIFHILSYAMAWFSVSLLDWNLPEAPGEENLGYYQAFTLCQVLSPCHLFKPHPDEVAGCHYAPFTAERDKIQTQVPYPLHDLNKYLRN